ncbi:MAG: hypothetical protein IGS48_08350 [Oscillatoriales cyanobacterium C42_A2020_001]|nr:hypothetical protein [Leptolyngbyaceae cyanobacterium C42_A2020_001]
MNLLRPLQTLLRPPLLVWEHVLVSLVLATLLGRAIAALNSGLFPQKYPQLIVGELAWEVGSKSPDYLILAGFLVAFFLVYPGLRLLSAAIEQTNGSVAEEAFRQLLLYALIPIGLWISYSCLSNDPTLDLILFSTVLLLLVLAFAGAALVKRLETSSKADYVASVGGSVLLVPLALFNGVALMLALSRLNLAWQFQIGAVILAAGVGVGVAIAGLIVLWLRAVSHFELQKQLRFCLGLAQIGLPLYFFALLPTPWIGEQGRFWGDRFTPALYGLIAVLMAISYLDWGKRLRRQRDFKQPTDLFLVLSPLCLVGLLLYIKMPIAGANFLNPDDYHWGEFLLPWWLWQTFHYVPFQDYEPARGLVNYVPGLFANLFFSGDAASYLAVASKPILSVPYFAIALPILANTIGLLPAFLALIVMPSPGGLFEIDLLVTAGLCLLANAFVVQHWVRYLVTWLALCPLLILFAPGNGGLFTIATFPLTAIALYQTRRLERRYLLRGAIVVVGVALVLIVFTPLDQMLLGAIRYGLEQSSLNSVAYGYEWFKSRGSQTFLSYSLWELVRASWIVITVGLGLLTYQVVLQRERVQRSRFLAFTVPVLLIAVLLIPRAAGRIDPGSLSRLGQTSAWIICLLLPIVLMITFERRGRAVSLLGIALVGGLLGFGFEAPPSFERIMQQPVAVVNPIGLNLVNGAAIGLPVLDGVVADPAHLLRLQKVKAIMNAVLEPGETYLDLTNRNAQYFYLGYPPPIQAGAVYNVIHKNQQLRAVQRLQTNPPPVVFAADAASRLSGNQVALRSHLIYRYVVENYVPVAVDQFLLLVQPDRVQRLKALQNAIPAVDAPLIPMVLDADASTRMTLLDYAFELPQLDGVPSSWGRSFGSLKSTMRKVGEVDAKPALNGVETVNGDRYKVTSANPRLTLDVSALNVNGRDTGLLVFDFACKKRSKGQLAIRWQSTSVGSDPEAVMQLTPRNGKQIVPLDAAPRWLLAKGIQTVSVEPLDPACTEFSLSNFSLYQRAEVANN